MSARYESPRARALDELAAANYRDGNLRRARRYRRQAKLAEQGHQADKITRRTAERGPRLGP